MLAETPHFPEKCGSPFGVLSLVSKIILKQPQKGSLGTILLGFKRKTPVGQAASLGSCPEEEEGKETEKRPYNLSLASLDDSHMADKQLHGREENFRARMEQSTRESRLWHQ